MSERLTDEQLRSVAQNWHPHVRAAAYELLALRARVAKLEAALKHAQEYMRPNQLLEYGPSLPEMLAAPQSNHLTDTSPEGVAEIKRVFEHCGEDTCRGFVEALIDALERERARVAKLEAALKDCKRYAEDHDDEWVPYRVDDALNDAPQ
jgi:hypothetical protein